MRLPIGNQKQLNLPMFFVGDRVKAFGILGTVIGIDDTTKVATQLPVDVRFDDGIEESFTWDGKLEPRHKDASLVLVEAGQ